MACRSKRRSTHDPEGIDPGKGARRSGSRGDDRRRLLEQRSVDRSQQRRVAAPAVARRPRQWRRHGSYTIGFANGGGVGNGWRESSICSVKAQAVKSGNVSSVTVIHHDTDAAGQLTDIRDLIAKDVDAIIINPNDPDALNPAIDEAIEAGIKVVAIDAFVTAKGAYNLSNDQVQYAYLGAKALFEQMGKKGAVVYMRGIAGHPADTDRDTGFKKALAEYPGHHGRQGGRDQVGSGDRGQPDQRHHEQRRARSTASGPRALTRRSSTP